MLAALTALPLFYVPASSKVMAANDAVINVTAPKQLIRGFGGMTHSGWIGDLTASERKPLLAMGLTSWASLY